MTPILLALPLLSSHLLTLMKLAGVLWAALQRGTPGEKVKVASW